MLVRLTPNMSSGGFGLMDLLERFLVDAKVLALVVDAL